MSLTLEGIETVVMGRGDTGYEKVLIQKVKFLEAELRKWNSPHDDSDLQDMKKQAKDQSLAGKQAYIHALEWRVKHLEVDKVLLEEQLDRTQNNLGRQWEKVEKLSLEITRLEAQGRVDLQEITEEAEAKVKSLEAELRSGKNCCHPLCLSEKVQLTEKATKYFNACNDLNIRIIELKEGINRYLDDPEFETDILSKLIKEGR